MLNMYSLHQKGRDIRPQLLNLCRNLYWDEGSLSSQSSLVLFNSYALDNNWHKAVINTAELATLSKEAAPAIK